MNDEQLEQAEEDLRQRVRALPGDKQRLFYRSEAKNVKDPDTYAVLVYGFGLGLHHFYLKQYLSGILDLLVLLVGCVLLFFHSTVWLGLLVLILLTGFELMKLFYSQRIVREYNLSRAQSTYRSLLD